MHHDAVACKISQAVNGPIATCTQPACRGCPRRVSAVVTERRRVREIAARSPALCRCECVFRPACARWTILVLSAGPKLASGTAAGGKGAGHTRIGSAIEGRPGTRHEVVPTLPAGMGRYAWKMLSGAAGSSSGRIIRTGAAIRRYSPRGCARSTQIENWIGPCPGWSLWRTGRGSPGWQTRWSNGSARTTRSRGCARAHRPWQVRHDSGHWPSSVRTSSTVTFTATACRPM